MLFLAQFTLRTSYYMSDRDKVEDIVRIIEADSEEEAKIKLHKEYKVDYNDYQDQSKSFSFEYNYDSSKSFNEVTITSSIK